MRPVLVVFAKELRESLRERRTLFSALLFGPIFVAGFFSFMLSVMVSRTTSDAQTRVDLTVSHAERAPQLLGQLAQYGGLNIAREDLDDAAARRAVESGRHKLVLQIPPQYATQLAAGAPAPLLLFVDASDSSAGPPLARLRGLLEQYSLLIGRLRLYVRGVDPLLLSPLALQTIDVSTPAGRSVLALGILSYLLLLTMLMGGLYLAIDATAGERERGSLEPLLTVPVRREQLIYGKVLASCALMLLSLSLTVSVLALVLRFSALERVGMSVNFSPHTVLAIILCCAPLAPLGAALMTSVAAFTRTYREAQTYLGLILMVPTLPVVFAGIANLRPTPWLMAVPSLSQHFLLQSVLRAEAIRPLYAVISVCVTLAAGALLTLLAGRLYRREALLG